MGYQQPTYVIFDGDKDQWAYRYMRGWRQNEHVDFDFRDAHDLTTMTSRASDEDYVKGHLKKRMDQAAAVIVLVGEATRYLYRYVRWEIELALELGIAIVVVNLNDKRTMDADLCPAILRDECAVHIPFKMKAIRNALDQWPAEFRSFNAATKAAGARHYGDDVYRGWGDS